MKRIVSISLGTSKRDKRSEITLLGQDFLLERIGTDGDMDRYSAMFRDLDGKVDAIGVGGADIAVVVGDRRYEFKQIADIARQVKVTPVVDGGGLKHTLERETIETLQREHTVDFANSQTLLVSAVDRFGMAQALSDIGGNVIYGDLLFGLGLPFAIRDYKWVKRLGAAILPIVTKLPFKWVYPTGEKQLERKPKFGWAFDQADTVCGDWHYIRRYAPNRMEGKTVLTQTLRKDDLELLKGMGVNRAITTTPVIGGETFATNVMEGLIVALLGRRPEELTASDYLAILAKLEWKPNVLELRG
ncbi:hypothetical protein BH11ARM2_BH11ARM2_05610 [soil metagenome]